MDMCQLFTFPSLLDMHPYFVRNVILEENVTSVFTNIAPNGVYPL